MPPPHEHSSPNPSSIKTRFAHNFLRALKRLNKHQPTSSSSSSPRDIYRRYRMVKIASDASMASAVGSRRLWSRTLLWKIRCRARYRALITRRRIRITSCSMGGLRRRSRGGTVMRERDDDVDQVNELQRLVPGGETMDLQKLFGETAHYIECLTIQVQVMRNLVEFCST